MSGTERSHSGWFALHHLGFRPFFLLGALFAVVSMSLWMWLYHSQGVIQMPFPSQSIWHAHEMIFGYGLAIIAGFLLTAVGNWTGVQTLHGVPLLLLALLWLLARVVPFIALPNAIYWMATFDLLFSTGLCISLLYPIVKVKQWSQIGVWSKVLLLLATNALFYAGLMGQLQQGVAWGLYAGFYLLVSMILMMGRRVIPFFIEKGTGSSVAVKNPRWIDMSSLLLMLIFIVVEVFLPYPVIAAMTALLLFIIHSVRLYHWYHRSIWSRPLLWVLYIAYGWIVLGFLMKAAPLLVAINPLLSTHAFAVGGIGLMTVGMMARVVLGHTGRDVSAPPRIVTLIFLFMLLASLLRVFFPMIVPLQYPLWVGLSQGAWIISFVVFCYVYAPMLLARRIDGADG